MHPPGRRRRQRSRATIPYEVYIAAITALVVPDLGYGYAILPYRTSYSDEPLHFSSHVATAEVADGSFGKY